MRGLLIDIFEFFDSIELRWKRRWESRTDFIGTVATYFRWIVKIYLAYVFLYYSLVLFGFIVTSDIFEVTIELIKYLILIFIFGYLALAALPPGLDVDDDDIVLKNHFKNSFELPFNRIKDKISMIRLESFTYSWFRTTISLFFFGIMIYTIITLLGWMYMGFEIPETTHTGEYSEQEYYRR